VELELLDPEGRRLLWRCRRGMKELDVLLERFARGELARATTEQRRTLERLLELPDPLLAEYLLGNVTPPEPELAQLARRIAGRASFVEPSVPGPEPVAVAGPVRHDPAIKRVP